VNSTLFFLLSLLVILGKFADFLAGAWKRDSEEAIVFAGPAEQEYRAPRPTAHYISYALNHTSEFLRAVFGGDYIRGQGYLHCFLISAFFVQGTLVFSALFSYDTWSSPRAPHFPAVWIVFTLFALVVANFLVDILSVVFTRHLLRLRLALDDPCQQPPPSSTVYLNRLIVYGFPLVLIIYGALLVTTVNISYSIIITIRGLASGYTLSLSEWWDIHHAVLTQETIWRMVDPVGEGYYLGAGGANALYFCLTPLLAPMLVVFAVTGAFIMESVDRLSRGRLSNWVRATHKERSRFLLWTTVVALVGSGAAALLAAFGGM
jgi:hypothetical protein